MRLGDPGPAGVSTNQKGLIGFGIHILCALIVRKLRLLPRLPTMCETAIGGGNFGGQARDAARRQETARLERPGRGRLTKIL